jgi:hypothetical protein
MRGSGRIGATETGQRSSPFPGCVAAMVRSVMEVRSRHNLHFHYR